MWVSSAVTPSLKHALVLVLVCASVASEGCGDYRQAAPAMPLYVSLSPIVVSVQILLSQPFKASVQDDPQDKGVTWVLTESGNACIPMCGTLTGITSSQVTYLAPSAVPNPGTVTLTATAVADTTKSTSATILIIGSPSAISVELSLATASVPLTQAQAYTVSVQNDLQNKGVTWGLAQAGAPCAPSCGTLAGITSEGATYDAPNKLPNQTIVTLTAVSVADKTKSATTMITITNASQARAVTFKLCDDEYENPNCTSIENFDVAQFRDLYIWVNWQILPTGSHTQQLDFYLPQGHSLYVSYLDGIQITVTPTGSALVMRVLPVAGTWITQRSLTGTWEIDLSIDGQFIASKTFQFYDSAQ